MQTLVDAMNNAAAWVALEPDQVTPSTELTVSAETSVFRYGEDGTSLQVVATQQALNHQLHRSLANLDWGGFDELRLWLRSNRAADGSSTQPFYLELRLASAAMGLAHPNNTWYRYLLIAQAQQWELVRISLQDLPVGVRSAVNLIQIRCIAASFEFVCQIDDLMVVREEMLSDVERALFAQLHHRLTLGGNLVAAFLAHPGVAEPAFPYIRLARYGLHLVPQGQRSTQERIDFVGDGYTLLPASIGYALFYEIEGRAAAPEESAQLFEFVLQRFSPYGQVLVNNVAHRIELINFAVQEELGPKRAEQFALRFKVYTRQEVGVPQRVTLAHHEVEIETGYRSP